MQLLNKYFIILLVGLLVAISCSDNSDVGGGSKDDLELLSTYDIAVAEPSGLAINKNGTALYTVSDNTAKVYKLSMNGDVTKIFNYTGNDLEGVTTFKDLKLLLAEERTKELVEFDLATEQYTKHKIQYDNNQDNSGIEGVAYAENIDAIFILNEKDPGKLIRLRSDFTVLAEYSLDFANDYSGIFYDSSSKNLWIVSDQSKTISICTLTGDVLKSYSISITQAEGIVITKDKIYVISDAEEKLYMYKKP